MQTPTQGYRNQKNRGNMTPPKEHTKLPITDPKEIEIHKLLYKEFKIIVPKKLRELQENTDKQFSEIGKTIQEHNTKFSKEKT